MWRGGWKLWGPGVFGLEVGGWDARIVVEVWEGWIVGVVGCVDGEGMVGGDEMVGNNAQ